MRTFRFLGASLLTLAVVSACSDTAPTVPESDLNLARLGQTCAYHDNARTKVRTVSAGCVNSQVTAPAGWTIRVHGAGPAPADAVQASVSPAFTPIQNPDAAYIAATNRIDISGISDFTTVTQISDGTQTVTFSIPMEKRSVPGSWGTWATPPFVETATPHILYTQGAQTLTMTLAVPAEVFGFELGPNPFAFHTFTAEFYSGATLVGTVTRQISGDNGARLMAASGDGETFDRVVVTGTADFSIANVRYGGQFSPPVEVDIDNVYSGDPPRASGVINLEDEWVYVEILDVEQYLGRSASPSDVRIGDSFATGTPAESFQILDINNDGNLDIRLRFSLDELVDDGHLTPNTTEITVWGYDEADDQLYRGTAEVEVIIGDVMIDQNQPDASVYMAAFAQTDLAQSFQTQQSANPTVGAGIFLQPNVGTTDMVRISLWTALPNQGGTMLRQGQAMGTQGQWVDVFWDPIQLTPNTTYYLVFDGNTTLGISGSVANPYPFGMVFANPGFTPFPSFDYTFRTWIAAPSGGMTPAQVQQMRTSAPSGAAVLTGGVCPMTASPRSCR